MTDGGGADIPARVYHVHHGIEYDVVPVEGRDYAEIEPTDEDAAPEQSYSGYMARRVIQHKLDAGGFRAVEDAAERS